MKYALTKHCNPSKHTHTHIHTHIYMWFDPRRKPKGQEYPIWVLNTIYIYIYIYVIIIIIKSLRQHKVSWLFVTLSLSLSISLSSYLSISFVIHPYHTPLPEGLLGCILCPYRVELFTGRSMLMHPCIVVLKRTLLMRLSLLLQQWFACLFLLIWMVCKMENRWPYSSCFEGCCFQDLFKIVRSILV